MAFRVSLTERASRDLAHLFETLKVEESDQSLRWYQKLKSAILSLENNPNRCPVTPEDKKLRHLLFGHRPHIYRIIYRVLPKQKLIEVLHIRHGAQQPFGPLEPFPG